MACSAESSFVGRMCDPVRAQVLADPARHLIPLSAAARAESYER